MSVPRRIPPSSSTGTRPATLAATSGRASIVAGTVSRLRPPWLETMSPATPSSTARPASATFITPFSSTGRRVSERSHAISCQESFGSSVAL